MSQGYMTATLCLLRRPSKNRRRSDPGSYEVTAFALGPDAHKTIYAPSRSGIYSPSPMELLCSSTTDLQTQMCWWLLLLMLDLQAAEPDMVLRTLTPMENFCTLTIL